VEIRIINQREAKELLDVESCIHLMADVLKSLEKGRARMPLRSVLWPENARGGLAAMPSTIEDLGIIGLKVITVFPGNTGTPYDAHQGAVLLFETDHGRPLAMVDATAVTAVRTAAVSAVATDVLARKDAADLALLGSGTQAHAHLEAIACVRPLRGVRVWSPTRANAVAFAQRESERRGLDVEAADSAEEAVAGADIVCTVTTSREPVLFGEWVREGAHINAVGACLPSIRELDTHAVVRSRLFVDRRESAMNEAGDFLIPKAEGAVDDSHIVGELGEILTGKIPGRETAGEITLFKSLGLAVEDLAAARLVYAKAVDRGAGTLVELGGSRDVDA